MLKMSSFMFPRSHEVRSLSLLIHSWYCMLGLLFLSSSLISSIGFFLFKRWWRTSRPWTMGVIWFHNSRKFVVFNLIAMKLENIGEATKYQVQVLCLEKWKMIKNTTYFGLQVFSSTTMQSLVYFGNGSCDFYSLLLEFYTKI